MAIIIKSLARKHLSIVATLEKTCFGADAWSVEAFAELFETYRESSDFRGQLWVAIEAGTNKVLGLS